MVPGRIVPLVCHFCVKKWIRQLSDRGNGVRVSKPLDGEAPPSSGRGHRGHLETFGLRHRIWVARRSAKSQLRFLLGPTECCQITGVSDDFVFVVPLVLDRVAIFGNQFELQI